MAPRARFELATLRLTAEMVETPNALFGVAYRESWLIFGPSVGLLGLPTGGKMAQTETAFRKFDVGKMKREIEERFEKALGSKPEVKVVLEEEREERTAQYAEMLYRSALKKLC
jgi:hypothetical protein